MFTAPFDILPNYLVFNNYKKMINSLLKQIKRW
jgi:hypothetical protein